MLELKSNLPEYDIGCLPPIGYVPELMHAWSLSRTGQGLAPTTMPTWVPGHGEVLVLMMAAGMNYNSVWADLGEPVSVLDFHKEPYHVVGSDGAGVVWAVGEGVSQWQPGDEVIMHCNRVDGTDIHCNGGDPLLSESQKIWGYETPDGAFAQFSRVQQQQLLPKPTHLSWPEAACFTLTLATAYRMLFGYAPHVLKPGQNVLVWGGTGGLGVSAIQLCNTVGANAIAVVSSDERAEAALQIGAVGVLNRKNYNCWGELPDPKSDEYASWMNEVRRFGKDIWKITGKQNVDMVLEHPGQQTFAVSTYLVKRGGMVVFCGGTSGFKLTFDARFAWMHQKRVQGSHFATLKDVSECVRLVEEHKIEPLVAATYNWQDMREALDDIRLNRHDVGNIAIRINDVVTSPNTVQLL